MATNNELQDRILREAECQAFTGLSRTTRWRMEAAGEFPSPIKITGTLNGWRLSELQEWAANRPRAIKK